MFKSTRKTITMLVSLLLVLLIALTGCGGSGANPDSEKTPEGEAKQGPKVVTMVIVSNWDSLIPHDTTSSYSDVIINQIFDKLAIIRSDGTFAPRLADTWEMNEDSTVFTFKLNENAKWHDGKPVTANDVVFTAQVMSMPTYCSTQSYKILYRYR